MAHVYMKLEFNYLSIHWGRCTILQSQKPPAVAGDIVVFTVIAATVVFVVLNFFFNVAVEIAVYYRFVSFICVHL